MTAARICCECDQFIFGEAREIVRHSASGARPNDLVHADQCPPRELVRPTVARRLPSRRLPHP